MVVTPLRLSYRTPGYGELSDLLGAQDSNTVSFTMTNSKWCRTRNKTQDTGILPRGRNICADSPEDPAPPQRFSYSTLA